MVKIHQFVNSTINNFKQASLTKEYSQVFDVVDENLQGLAVDVLDDVGRGGAQIEDPFKDLLFMHQISRVNFTEFVSVEN